MNIAYGTIWILSKIILIVINFQFFTGGVVACVSVQFHSNGNYNFLLFILISKQKKWIWYTWIFIYMDFSVHRDTQTILTIQNHVITKNHRISLLHSEHKTWQLKIKDIRESDRGFYMCQLNTVSMKLR